MIVEINGVLIEYDEFMNVSEETDYYGNLQSSSRRVVLHNAKVIGYTPRPVIVENPSPSCDDPASHVDCTRVHRESHRGVD